MSKYYPWDYYSYRPDNVQLKRKGFFQQLQRKSIVSGKKSVFGKLITYKYKHPEYYDTIRDLKLIKTSSPILDVGSGSGELLKSFYKAGYSDLTGVDPFIEKDIVYNKHLRIEKKNIFEITRQYDAIMMHHSLEHMDNQAEVLKQLYKLLSPTGTLLIRIPIVSEPLMKLYGVNVVSLDPPRHFYIHTENSIRLLLEKTGFKIDKLFYDAHEFSFWASEQYKNGVSLNNDPRSHLITEVFSKNQIMAWKEQIAKLNEQRQSDTVVIYCYK